MTRFSHQQMVVSTVAVALPLPLYDRYTYAVNGEVADYIQLGQRVVVPFQGRVSVAYVVELNPPEVPNVKLKHVAQILDREASTFDPLHLSLAQWVASYYQAPLGEVLRAAHPAGTNGKSKPSLRWVSQDDLHSFDLPSPHLEILKTISEHRRTVELDELKEAYPDLSPQWIRQWVKAGLIEKCAILGPPRIKQRTEKEWFSTCEPSVVPRGQGGRILKRDLLHRCIADVGPIAASTLRSFPEYQSSYLRQLFDEGLVANRDIPLQPSLFDEPQPTLSVAPKLNSEQQEAVDEVVSCDGYGCFLLEGVTGSGKTEVYMGIIKHWIDRDCGALILVPEIALTPQLITRFRARFGDTIAVLHSGMSEQHRLAHWRRLRSGEARIAIGARSAVFAPVHQLSIIVVDEEHDASFKQNEGVRYHGRDVAIVRAHQQGCPIVLGSATPSLESVHNVERERYRHLLLSARATGSAMPTVELIDQRRHPNLKESPMSRPLLQAIEETLKKEEQTIIFLNRRGHSNFALCDQCGEVIECDECSISMTWHQNRHHLSCHYCHAARRLPPKCPACGEGTLMTIGAGTERIEETLAALFPHASVDRLDRDTAGGKGLGQVLERMRSRQTDILVGTQMVTKGHDFPFVTLVCVLDADAGLKLPDFRAAERSVQLLLQVAGRAGRADRPGRVLVQTYQPEHHALTALQTHDHRAFLKKEEGIRELFEYPPFAHAVAIRAESTQNSVAQAWLSEAMVYLKLHGANHWRYRGPAPAVIERVRGKFRWALLVTADDRKALHQVVAQLRAAAPKIQGLKTVFDIDPQDLM